MYFNSELIELSTEQVQLISSEEAFHFSIVPKAFDKDFLTFYIDRKKESSLSEIKNELGLIHDTNIILEMVDTEVIKKTLTVYYRKQKEKEELEKPYSNEFFENLIEDAIRCEASDVHFEIYDKVVRVRFRIDGRLVEKLRIPKENYSEVINQVKIKSRLNITEKRLPQDGRIRTEEFDIRVSFLPTQYGEKVVMRLLRRENSKLKLENLGLDKSDMEVFTKNIKKPNGIVLISGPTGSGKTTTLYAVLQFLNNPSKNILTIEDPIEYTLEGVNQVQINEEIGLTFSRALKSFLRQDPDIIMLGEIRDSQTAQMAIRAALTGHLVLSTIHTNSSSGTISRLQDMGIPSYLIAETLNMSVAQRLVRILCSECKLEIENEDDPFLTNLKMEHDSNQGKRFISKGCESCFYTGYSGRRAIYEILPVDKTVGTKIKKESNSENYSAEILRSLAQQALLLVINGETSLEEVYPILSNHR